MNKAARIKAFVELEQKNNLLIVQKCSPLFDKLLVNVKNEYKRFHGNREPRINNFEIAATETIKPSSDHAGYLQGEQFIESFNKFRESQELPFSITQEIRCVSPTSQAGSVRFPSQHILRRSYFVNSSVSRETFHQIQRQHKIFWMKYGGSPGKYSISDQKSGSLCKFVNIRSSVDEAEMDVEQLKMFSLKDCIKNKDMLNSFLARVPNRKKEIIPDVIETAVDLQIASFALLLDGVNLSEDYTALHRRSAPYQLVLLSHGESKDLVDLARYIELLVNATDPNIEILNASKTKILNNDELKVQFDQLDIIGIPYAIVLDDKALEHGLMQLRNRNTTLYETIHLSDVTNYLIKIFASG